MTTIQPTVNAVVEPESDGKPGALTLARGIQVLELLGRDGRELTVAEIALQLKLHRQTIYRLLNTLVEHNLVHRVGSNRFGLGLGVLHLARNVHGQMQRIVHPHLRRLSEEMQVTAHCVVAENNEAVVLCLSEPDEAVFVRSERVGARRPMDQGASGIAILSAREPRPDDSADVMMARNLGYVITRGQVTPNATGVAAPLVHTSGRSFESAIVAISMHNNDTQLLIDAVLRAARAISQELSNS
jgi:DNA-binding IclR family transcriptional regulator